MLLGYCSRSNLNATLGAQAPRSGGFPLHCLQVYRDIAALEDEGTQPTRHIAGTARGIVKEDMLSMICSEL